MAERTPTDRFLNTGIPVQTKKLGEVEVRELPLESLLIVLEDVVALLNSELPSITAGVDNPAELIKVLANERTLKAVKKIMAHSTDQPVENFDKMGTTDWLRLIAAMKQVMNWQEMKELFFQIVPREVLSNLKTTPQEP